MRVLVSACPMGKNCKYNGGNNCNARVIDFLKDKEVVEVCPEVLGGLSTPRPPAELVDGVAMTIDGNSVDAEFRRGVEIAMQKAALADIDMAILQSRSPTCGVKQIYDGSFSGRLIEGRGLFAQALLDAGYNTVDAENI